MSSLLKEAIVDANALRDSALKNAETTIIEKYSDEVREAVNQLLEQDELGMEEPAGSTEEVVPNIPLAATDNLDEEEGDVPPGIATEGEEVPVNISLDALQEAVAALEAELEESEEIEINEEELANILAEDEEELEEIAITGGPGEVTAEEDKDDMDQMEEELNEEEEGKPDEDGDNIPDWADKNPKKAGDDEDRKESTNEDIDADSLVDAIMEKLTVDMGADLSGWAGRSAGSVKWEMEKELAHRRSTDLEQDLKDLKKAHEDLVFENKQVNEQNSQYKQAFNELRENLQTVNLSNARLLYTNRVLRNTSLNERQKEKIVEAISKAGSVTEAKTIFNTLQSTVESTPKRGPQSLSEAIGRRSSVIRASRQESTPSDPLQERMKRLAGIK